MLTLGKHDFFLLKNIIVNLIKKVERSLSH